VTAASARQFWTVVAGTLTGIAVWKFGAWALSNWSVPAVAATAALFVIANVLHLVWYWLEGRRGLGQWPNPHGRYYDEWMRLPGSAGDYYDWLAVRMDNREPWASWAQRERALSNDD
jgi:hypothetical protein